ncbi:MAG: orotidine 5'-phosphate decarboxylase, partial [Candidatus Nealsonbacteria bacterium]|nr:orotidine 5'-phosphate decarboxylase [Candidatus Nealsonbacteria bacterium]
MLNKKLRYLQIALNSTLEDAESIISQLPLDQRIILEAGTPLIKNYGARGIEMIRNWWARRILSENYLKPFIRNLSRPGSKPAITPYIVADMKCQDRGLTEVEITKKAGANAMTVNGNAPSETINALIEESKKVGLDSMIDMMNVAQPIKIMRA